MKTEAHDVFTGPRAMEDFLNPENYSLPLVELNQGDALNPFRDRGVRIMACLGYATPLFNIKALAVYNMLMEAKARGKLDGVRKIWEASSGNTAAVTGIMAPFLAGIDDVTAIVPWDLAPGKDQVNQVLSIDQRKTRENGPQEAARMGTQEGSFNMGQYSNFDNPRAFEKWLAPKLWKQTGGEMTVFCAALGTTGTVVGCSSYFRSLELHNPIHIVGVSVAAHESVPGARTLERLEEVKLPWMESLDYLSEAGRKEAFWFSLKLVEKGILAGPSSGLALAGLHKFLAERQKDSDLERLRNKAGEIVAVIVCADSYLPYLEKYLNEFEPEYFGGNRSPIKSPADWAV